MIIKSTLNKFVYNLRYHFVQSFSQKLTYTQRPFTTQKWFTQKASIKDALHSSWLMTKGVTPFNYNGYEWVCQKAIEHQAQLTKQDLLMLMQLGIQYHVRLSPSCYHIENQIFLRIHRDYELDMQDYDEQLNAEMKALYDKLQSKSKDYFKLLNEQAKEEDEQMSQDEVQQVQARTNKPEANIKREEKLNQTQQLIKELSDKLRQRKQKEFTIQDLLRVSQYLREWNSKNLQMIQYLQQLLTIKLQSQAVDASTALTYLKFLTYACQSLKLQYEENKQKYTVRSLKRIYKYQYFYFQEHFRQLITADATATPQFIEEVVQLYAAFPIKRREIRRKIGIYVGSQMQKFKMLERNDLKTILLEINGKDQKMKRNYRKFLHLPQPQPQVKELKQPQKTISNENTQPNLKQQPANQPQKMEQSSRQQT